ncbi:polypeptide [Zea mays]|uniref:Polypeptide n=1 Tax=Zea mays TaxID=4577 RepID=A0A1D6NHV8_MAIZE|nr:polypeptide [Zea mays]
MRHLSRRTRRPRVRERRDRWGDGERSSERSHRKPRKRGGGGRGVLERSAQVVPGPHPRLLRPGRAPTHCLPRYHDTRHRVASSRFLYVSELGKVESEPTDSTSDFLSTLKQHHQIAETKIAWLAKLFLWEPFFPVRTHDTLFHAMLLFSKHHRLNVAPVVESMNSSVIGFVTQDAVMELLLQSSGLEWLDKIADKQLSEFRFANVRKPVLVYSDQTLADGLHILSKEKTGVAVIDRKTSRLIGSLQCSDLYLFLDDSTLFSKRTTTTLEELISLNNKTDRKCSTAENSCAPGRNILALRSRQSGMVGLPATNLESDTLKQAMEKLTTLRSSCSFIVDEHGRVQGVVTTRDIISVFSPLCMDSRIDGATFFSAALEQAGCRVENGQMFQN